MEDDALRLEHDVVCVYVRACARACTCMRSRLSVVSHWEAQQDLRRARRLPRACALCTASDALSCSDPPGIAAPHIPACIIPLHPNPNAPAIIRVRCKMWARIGKTQVLCSSKLTKNSSAQSSTIIMLIAT